MLVAVALYGAAALAGPALHSLPGLGHKAAVGDEHPTPSPHDDCPICHFLALGQIPDDPTATIAPDRPRIAEDEAPRPRPIATVEPPSRPRGPPVC